VISRFLKTYFLSQVHNGSFVFRNKVVFRASSRSNWPENKRTKKKREKKTKKKKMTNLNKQTKCKKNRFFHKFTMVHLFFEIKEISEPLVDPF